MRYTLTFAPRALADLEKIKKSGDQARIKKLRTVLEELTEHPLTGIGNPERLKYKENTYSRRLSGKDRVVYSVYESIVQVNILQMLGHYDDK
ncbi:MAG: Txe/YoeB family addiction module toxin [Paludibacteraceae bacterium]|nr:Txe/YoeB family addiction module toxin [Paludibacteraceae bacterium]